MSASMPSLRARLDHVAVAVQDLGAAAEYWRQVAGGGLVGWDQFDRFRGMQLRFTGGGKLELLAPPYHGGGRDFVSRFLSRFGTTVHHVTLKVADLYPALEILRDAGYDVVDVDDTDRYWREGFLRPSQVGGVVVQVAWSLGGDAQWAARLGHAPESPADGAPRLRGPTLAHPDLDAAQQLWQLLGSTVEVGDDHLMCRWPSSPLDVVVERGEPAGPRALRFEGALPEPVRPDVRPPLETG